jgi:hypothetical protein
MAARTTTKPQVTAGAWLIDHVGYYGIGADLKLLSRRFNIAPNRLIRDEPNRYDVIAPSHGLILQLSKEKTVAVVVKAMRAEVWSLAGAILFAPAAKSPQGVWAWPWPFEIEPDHFDFAAAQNNLGGDNTGPPERDALRRSTFFIEGRHGAALAIELRFAPDFNRLERLWATHLGNAQPFTIL